MDRSYRYANVTGTGDDGLLITGRGVLHTITVNAPPGSDQTLTLYDSTAASGTLIGTITLESTCLNHPFSAIYDVEFKTGLHVVANGNMNVTIAYGKL